MGDDADKPKIPFTMALISGGIAGTTVDVALYPLDTLRTRMQSPEGFIKAGGFRGVWNGCLVCGVIADIDHKMAFFTA